MGLIASPIALAQLPAPEAIEPLDFETLYAQRKQKLIDLFAPEVRHEVMQTLALESEPMAKLLQENAYRELIVRQRINDCVRRVLLAFARGSDLDHIGARYNVKRLIVRPANPQAVPPAAEIRESDDAFLERIQDAYEGLSVAGPRGAYIFHARSADGRVIDAQAFSPAPCDVTVAILSHEGNGQASADLLDVVRAALNDEHVRPLGDRVTVQSAAIVDYSVQAVLHLSGQGPGADLVLQTATAQLEQFVYRRQRLGWPVWVDKLDALLHVPGVVHVERIAPAQDIALELTEAARCTAVNITLAEPEAQDSP